VNNDEKFYGRMNDPTSSSYIKGLCGEIMEFYLHIENDKIIEVKYYTEGCKTTKACAAMAANLALNKTVKEALLISAGEVIEKLENVQEGHLHCSILAVSTLYKAIAEYLLRL